MNIQQEERVARMTWATIYPLYLQKVARKGHSQEELDEVLCWLTGHAPDSLRQCVADEAMTLSDFFASCPQLNPEMYLIGGSICGHRLQDLGDGLMRRVRCMDKLVDNLAKRKPKT